MAELLHRDDPDGARWPAGRNKGWDVSGAGMLVDAKRAFLDTVIINDEPEMCIGFMGSAIPEFLM